MIFNRLAGATGALALTVAGVLAFSASPAQAEDGHYPFATWQVRDIATGDTEWSDAALSAIVDASTAGLTKVAGTTGTSLETADLGLPVSAGDEISVGYVLLDGADVTAGAVRMFYYDAVAADTLLDTPTETVAADGSGTLTIQVAADVTIGTFGLTFDASNDSTGTVRFTDLMVAGTPVLFVEPAYRPDPEPTAAATSEPSTEPTEDPAASGEELPATGPAWLPVAAIGGGAIVAGAALLLLPRRGRITFTPGEDVRSGGRRA